VNDTILLSAFYPIPKKTSRFAKNRGENPAWTPNDTKTISGMFNQGSFSKQTFDFVRYSKIKAEKDVPIAEEFVNNKNLVGKKLPILIFSHGVRGHRNFCSGFC